MFIDVLWGSFGHAGLEANKIADRAAKQAAEECKHWEGRDDCDKPLKELKSSLHKCLISTWQRQWDIQDTGRETHQILPNAPTKTTPFQKATNIRRSVESKLNRLKSGTHMLKSHKMRNNIDKKAGLTGDRLCECGVVQDVDHYLLECPNIRKERQEMFNKIEHTAMSIPGINRPKVHTSLLLGQKYYLPRELQRATMSAVCGFINSTADRFTI